MFPAIDELEQRVHGIAPFVLGACGAIGGYFYGLTQDRLPVALCVGIGLVIGLLLVPLLLKLRALLLGVLIVAAAALACYWLLNNEAALRHRQAAPVQQAAPAPDRSHSWLSDAGVKL